MVHIMLYPAPFHLLLNPSVLNNVNCEAREIRSLFFSTVFNGFCVKICIYRGKAINNCILIVVTVFIFLNKYNF